MSAAITEAISSFTTDLTSTSSAALGVAAAALLVWVGWRLVCKLTNRGTGK